MMMMKPLFPQAKFWLFASSSLKLEAWGAKELIAKPMTD